MKNTIKDENLLTTSSLTISRKGIYLGMSAILLMTGCSMPSISSIFGEDRPSQKVDGMRRTPTYNNRAIKSEALPTTETPAKISAKLPPMVTNVSPERVETALDSPYDKYDTYGNEVPEVEIAQKENESKNKKGFFSGWFGFGDDAPKESEELVSMEPKTHVEHKVEPLIARKAFLGNPYTPKPVYPQIPPQSKVYDAHTKDVIEEQRISFNDKASTEKITTPELVVAPVADAVDPVVNSASNIESANSPAMTELPREYKAVSAPDIESQPEPEEETLLGRIGSSLNVFELSAKAPDTIQQTPDISSVPQRPEAFNEVKREQQQNFNELKQDHSISKQEKESLEREAPAPSMPALSNQPSSSVQPLIESSAPVVVADSVKDEALPSPILDVATTPAAQPVTEQPPAPFLASEKANVEEDVKPEAVESSEEEKPSLFERIFGKSSESNQDDEVVSEKIENEIPVYSGPVSSLNEVTIEASSDANEKKNESKIIDDLAASATAIATKDSPFEPAADAETLPSPEIIKTMRPSRYDARRTQTSDY